MLLLYKYEKRMAFDGRDSKCGKGRVFANSLQLDEIFNVFLAVLAILASRLYKKNPKIL